MNNKTDRLTASEALYGFCGWLMSRRQKTVMSSMHEAGPVAELIREFIDRHDLQPPRDGYEENIVAPEKPCNQKPGIRCKDWDKK